MINFTLDERFTSRYAQNTPNHIVIDDFLNHDKASRIEEALEETEVTKDWYKYDNLFEKKIATDNVDLMPIAIKNFLSELNSQEFIKYLEAVTGIDGLIPDPWLRGGGIHVIPRGGFLDLHADRSFHPKLKLYRRVNVLVYFNRNYSKSMGGQLELWDKDVTKCLKSIEPTFNRAVIFNTDATSFHGHPVTWNSANPRVSLATYYFTSTIPDGFEANMESTDFRSRPGDPVDTIKDALRSERRKLRL